MKSFFENNEENAMTGYHRAGGILGILSAIGMLIASLTGLITSVGASHREVSNVFGQTVELYGSGIYANDSVLQVSNRLGGDALGVVGAVSLLVTSLFLWKDSGKAESQIHNKILVLHAGQMFYCFYNFFCLCFGNTMNSLILLYIAGLGMSFFGICVDGMMLYKRSILCEGWEQKIGKGPGLFLVVAGGVTALIWIMQLAGGVASGDFGSIVGVQTTEVTMTMDTAIVCPLIILSGILLYKKTELGVKTGFIFQLLFVLIGVLVIFQRIFELVLSIEVPLQAIIIMIVSFIIMGAIGIGFLRKLWKIII